MVQSKATTVAQYLRELPADRRKVIKAVRAMILESLPNGYTEAMNWGMISYEVPLATYPDTYNGQPLMFAALASQKNYISLYLMCCYADSEQEAELKKAFADADKKLKMGKSCIRFKTVEDLPLEALGKIIGDVPVDAFVKIYEERR
ncbi:MAG: DUF1801 domain-containing protein [Pirellulales bacterium]|nr:DUF1801 domain-containing protein [Pirellulales bacterium]